MRVIPASEQRRLRWKNDGGWTTEIARDPLAGDAFRWRISIADIERDGPFSPFPGIDRHLLLLSGNGIELDIDGAPPRRLVQRFGCVRFAGEATVDCRLLGGPTRDFNLMVQRATLRAEVVARPLIGSMLIFAREGVEWLIHVLAGHLQAQGEGRALDAATGDTLHIDRRGASGTSRIALDGGGELVLVQLLPPD
ncbi:MAG: HutD family protein [Dokdonella sp.]|uniref:HutD/Ves family protein n=1 Tax=Dokdonella sp. TaxID=2291710 RepID=UPI0025BF4492|nr:HutD family protein [Dokdonella sp.]MBX3699457.1 HutD family protein [Dokdonella sp.]